MGEVYPMVKFNKKELELFSKYFRISKFKKLNLINLFNWINTNFNPPPINKPESNSPKATIKIEVNSITKINAITFKQSSGYNIRGNGILENMLYNF